MALPTADQDLFAAIEAGSLPALQEALAKGANPNAKKAKQTALEYALSQRQRDAAALALIEAGADVAPVKDRIVWAVGQPLSVLEKFLAAGADPDTETFAGRPVQVAARAGLLPQVQRLLAAGADPNLGTLIGNALTDAIRDGHLDCVRELLRGGAKPDQAEAFGPILPVLVELGESETLRALLEAGADPNARYTLHGPHSRVKKAQREASREAVVKGLEAITSAVSGSAPSDDDDDESLEDLEKRLNAEIDTKVHDATRVRLSGVTPLMVAAAEGAADMVALLLDHAADPNVVDDEGRTALAIAEARGHDAVAERLRARGALAEAPIPADQALALAAERGDVSALEAAVARGAQIDSHDTRKSADGKTPLGLAVENGHAEAVRALLRLGADLEHKARTSPHNLRALLDNESQERTPLHVAAALGRTEIVTLLLDAGASPKARDESRETPLHLAAAANQIEAIRLLLARGADVDAKGRDNMTPLLYAAARGHAEAGEALLEGGADARAASRSRESALHFAVSSRSVPLVRALVARGADPRAPNKYGSSALERGAHLDEIGAILATAPKAGAKPPSPPRKAKAGGTKAAPKRPARRP